MPPHGRPDEDLIRAFQAGELGAFGLLVERHKAGIVNFFYHLCYDRSTAEDLAQEVFIRLFEHLSDYEPRARFSAFLYRVAKNLWIDWLRRHGAPHRRGISIDGAAEPSEEDVSPLKDRLPAGEELPQEFVLRDELRIFVRKALDQLPEEHRMVVLLSEIHGMRYEEIAESLGIPVGTVKSRMHHAMERLKNLLRNVYP